MSFKNAVKSIFDPSKELEDAHYLWFWVALAFLLIAVAIAWGDQTAPEEILRQTGDKFLSNDVEYSKVNLLMLRPGVMGTLVSAGFVAMLFIRGCIGCVKSPWVYVLIVGDVLLFASFFEILLSEDSIELFKLPFLPSVSVTPRALAVFIVLLTCIGGRTLAGLATILLALAEVLVFAKAEDALGTKGVVFVLASFISLLLQLKIPGLSINKSFTQVFLDDIGRGAFKMKLETMNNFEATGRSLEKAGRAVTDGVKTAVSVGASYAMGDVSGFVVPTKQRLSNENKICSVEKE